MMMTMMFSIKILCGADMQLRIVYVHYSRRRARTALLVVFEDVILW